MPNRDGTLADPASLLTLSPEGQRLLFTQARTVYRFRDEPVGDDRLRAIWELFKWAPTSGNINPLRIVYVRTPESKQRLLPAVNPPNRPKCESAPVVAILATDTGFPEYVPFLNPAAPGLQDLLMAHPEQRDETGGFNSVIQAGYFLLAVRAAGLSAGPMKGFDPKAVDEEFFPDGRWRSILLVNIGKPAQDGTHPRQPRLAYEQAVQLI